MISVKLKGMVRAYTERSSLGSFQIRFRPSELPPAESLYDELQIARKEIATQKKVITQQKTRNDRLESDLKKREAQMEEILSGSGSKRYAQIYFRTFNHINI